MVAIALTFERQGWAEGIKEIIRKEDISQGSPKFVVLKEEESQGGFDIGAEVIISKGVIKYLEDKFDHALIKFKNWLCLWNHYSISLDV